MNEERSQPTPNQPLNADRPRPRFTAAVAVIGLLALVAGVFVLITWLRYNTT